MKRLLVVALIVLTVPTLAGAQQQLSSPPGVEVRADQELKSMGAFMANLPRFTFEVPDGARRVDPVKKTASQTRDAPLPASGVEGGR